MTSEEMKQMVIDVTTGKPAPKDEGEEAGRARDRIAAQVAEIIAKGGTVEIPSEIE